MTRLFSSFTRTDAAPRGRLEGLFGFYDRSARPEFVAVRDLFEQWFVDFPSPQRTDLAGRFRSRDDRAHSGALLELFLHAVFRALRWDVSPGGIGEPDLHVTPPLGSPFWVEATFVQPRDSLFATNPHEEAVFAALDALPSPNFFLHLEKSGELTAAPPRRAIVREFAALVAAHKPDEVQALIERSGYRAAPFATVRVGTWELTGRLMPKSSAGRGKPGRTVGVDPMRGGWTDDSTPVKKAVINKGAKYRDLSEPYVVAVNAPELHDRIDEMDALFGKEQYTVYPEHPEIEPEFGREPDGAWIDEGGPRYRNVDAVLVLRGVHPWAMAQMYCCLYINPWIERRLPDELLVLPHAVPEDKKMVFRPGLTFAEVFQRGSDPPTSPSSAPPSP